MSGVPLMPSWESTSLPSQGAWIEIMAVSKFTAMSNDVAPLTGSVD